MLQDASQRLTGLVAATHTPFHPDGSLALPVVEKQAGHLLGAGVSTVFVGGSTGESHSLTLDERRALTHRWCEIARGTPLRVVVHVGANCLEDARTLAAHAQQHGAVAVSALAPSYFKPRNVESLVACCAHVSQAAPATPFYFYDIPSMTGVSLSMPDFLAQARERIPMLAGLKFTNPDLMAYQLCLTASQGGWDVPWGTDEALLAALAVGATGAVGSTYNFAAPVYLRLMQAFAAHDFATARMEQMRSVRTIAILARHGYMGAAKAVMGILGVPVGPARLPHSNPSAEEASQLRRELESIGFFDFVVRIA